MNPEFKNQPLEENNEKENDINKNSRSPLIPFAQSSDESSSESDDDKPQSVNDRSYSKAPMVTLTQTTLSQQKKSGISLPLVILFLIISFLCGLILALWFFQNELKKEKYIQQNNTTPVNDVLNIGTSDTVPPMEFRNASGKLVGYDIDLGNRIAKEMGLQAKFTVFQWDSLFNSLEENKIDMLISSITITDERRKLYAFSDPYLDAGEVIISRKDSPIVNAESLQGKKVAVHSGTVHEKSAYKYTKKELVELFPTNVDIGEAVSVGSAEAVLTDLTLAKGMVRKHVNLTISSDPLTNEYYGIVFRKDNKELQHKVNSVLRILRVNGYVTDLKQKWLD